MFSLSIMALSDRHTSARIGDAFFKGVCYFFALAVILLMVLILIVLFKESWLSIKTFGFKFFYSTAGTRSGPTSGAAAIYSTVVSLIAIIIALPVSIGIAIFLTEWRQRLGR